LKIYYFILRWPNGFIIEIRDRTVRESSNLTANTHAYVLTRRWNSTGIIYSH